MGVNLDKLDQNFEKETSPNQKKRNLFKPEQGDKLQLIAIKQPQPKIKQLDL